MLHTVGFTNSDRYKCLENLKKGAVDLCLTYCGWENCDPGHRFGPNKRISHVLHIVESGTGVFEMDGQQYHLTGGEAFLIPSSVEAWYEAGSDPCKWFQPGKSGPKDPLHGKCREVY